jgi:hypothetical protein
MRRATSATLAISSVLLSLSGCGLNGAAICAAAAGTYVGGRAVDGARASKQRRRRANRTEVCTSRAKTSAFSVKEGPDEEH